jgi:hypothetical protein
VACAPLRRVDKDVYLGIDDDDLPAAQCFSGNSHLLVAPAWRLPPELETAPRALTWVTERLASDYGLTVGRSYELGGRYHPSPGVTAEVVHPYAVTVTAEGAAPRRLKWIPLADIPRLASSLRDGHLRVLAWRAWHALAA